MVKTILTTKVNPAYDDLPEVRYHFPRTYLNQVRAALGDWIVYYEPRRTSAETSSRGGRQAYFAVARVVGIEPDARLENHFYANIEDYLDFDRHVPFRVGEQYYETGLQRPDGKTNKGAFGRAVRPISDGEFDQILAAGFMTSVADFEELSTSPQQNSENGGLAEPSIEYVYANAERRRIVTTTSKPFREEAFRRQVRSAYGNTCSMSGLRLINGGGRPEVQAAHIRPVSLHGPDSVRNGIALSGTLHWMFDRGLVTVGDDYSILAARQVPDDARRLLKPDMRLIVPEDETLRPHPSFLRFHRETIFKG
jgi:putative restriction endonuclease